jgi:hypothetical protein
MSAETDPGTRPSWLGPGLAFLGHWEPLVFRRRRGGQRTNEDEIYDREHSPAAVTSAQDAGCSLVVTHYDKGFGPTAQAADVATAREWAARLHEAGLKVGAYVRYDTLVLEALEADVPAAAEWAAVTSYGTHAAILFQPYRSAACPNSEEHLEYVEARIRSAIHDLGADLVHIDGFWTQHISWACHCDRCVACFRAFLEERYPTPEAAIRRFGHERLGAIIPPAFRDPDLVLGAVTRVTDPVLQEWAAYRASMSQRLAVRLAGAVREAAPWAAVAANSLMPIGYANGFYWGFELPDIAPSFDALWTEDDHWPGLREDGVIISRIREFKMGRALGVAVFSYQRAESERQLRLSIAQALAFNDGVIGMLGSPLLAEEPYFDLKRDLMAWVHEHAPTLADNQSAAEVALWRPTRSLALDVTATHRSVILVEQVLIHGQVPFDIVLDADLADLSRYRVLVVPDAVCMSDEQAAAIAAFVERGGGLVATDRTSLYDEWYRQRPDLALRALLGPDVLIDAGDPWRAPSTSIAGQAASSRFRPGSGRAAFIARVATARPPRYDGVYGELPYRFPTEEWQLPTNAADILEAVRWASGDAPTVEIDAPAGVVVDVQRRAGRETIVHVLDYDLGRDGPTAVDIRVRNLDVSSARVLRPGDEPEPGLVQLDAEVAVIRVQVDVYAAVILA